MKKIILIGFIFILLTSLALAYPSNVQNVTNVMAYYSFDTSSVTDSGQYSRNGTNYGASHNTTNCVLDGCWVFDGTNDYLDMGWGNSDQLDAYGNMGFVGTLCAWISADQYDQRRRVFERSGSRPGMDVFTELGKPYTQLDDEQNPYPQGSFGLAIANTSWHFLCVTWNSDSASNPVPGDGYGRAYMDGIEYALPNADQFDDKIDSTGSNTNWFMGKHSADIFWWSGKMDEASYYDIALNLTSINYLYNSGLGLNPFAAPAVSEVGSINMSTAEPLNSTQHNTLSLSLNTTINSSVQYNVTLYVNGLVNQTILNRAASQNKFIAFNLTWTNTTEVTFNYSIFAYGNQSLANATSLTNTIHIDNLRPGINFNVPSDLNTTIIKNTGKLFTNITLDDTNLFSFQYNITYVDNGSIAYTNSSSSLTGFTIYNVLDQVTLSNSGLYNALMRVCDGHTGDEIHFTAEVISNEIVAEEVEIALDDKSDTQDIDLIEQTDRYNFEFETYATSKTKEFVVESDKYIHIIESEFEGHLITGEKWIDFETADLKSVSITRVSDYKVSVIVEKYSATDQWDFASIGELNCRKLKRQLFVFAESALTPGDNNQIVSGSYTTFTLNLTLNETFMTGLLANLVYNGTSYPMTLSSTTNLSTFTKTLLVETSSNQNLSWHINYNVSGQNFSTIPRTQEVLLPILERCNGYSVQALNFTLKNEWNDSIVAGELQGYFKTWVSDINDFVEFNLTWGTPPALRETFAVCIFPSFATYTTYAQFQYGAPGFAYKNYYFPNTTINNDTKYIDLLLNPNTTQIQFLVVDTDDDPLENAYIKVLSYDIGSNSYKISEILKTDSDGIAYGQLVKSTGDLSHWYQFIIEYDYIVRLTTEPTKITEDTRTFRLSLVDTYFDQLSAKNSLFHNLSYNEGTGNFNFIFDDPSGTANIYCLKVEKKFVNSQALINKTCTTASSGVMLMPSPSNPTNSSIVASTFVVLSGSTFVLDVLDTGGSQIFKKFKKTGIFVTFLLTLTLVSVGIWNPAIAVIMTIFAVVVSIIMNIFYLQWPMALVLIILGIMTIYRINRK
tara:strand:+ start:8210 stop:11410 length:3201 start_codon:yes stop_codon:yes gene_type:complete